MPSTTAVSRPDDTTSSITSFGLSPFLPPADDVSYLEPADSRMWANSREQLSSATGPSKLKSGVAHPYMAIERIRELFSGDEDLAILRLQEKLTSGHIGILADLVEAIIAPSPEDEDGAYAALALETIAGLRSTILEEDVVDLVRIAAASALSDLRFTAIAAAGDLSREGRLEVLGTIKRLQNDVASDTRRAAKAFVESVVH